MLILDIQENKRIYIRSITFEGNEAFTEKDLLKQMSTKKRTLLGFFTDDGILQGNQLKQDVQKISSFYFNNGFINSQVGDPVITRDAKGIYIKMTIQEGKRFNVGKVQISGDEIGKSRESLFALLKTQEGKNYNREAVMRDIETITVAANDEGYAHAELVPETYDYLAPERISAGTPANLQADLYACGCLWWQLLTGRAPLAGGDSLAKIKAAHAARIVPLNRCLLYTSPSPRDS